MHKFGIPGIIHISLLFLFSQNVCNLSKENKVIKQDITQLEKDTFKVTKENELIDQCWSSKILHDIKKLEYNIQWQNSGKEYQSVNRAQNLHASYSFTKMKLQSRNKKDEWSICFQVKSIGRKDNVIVTVDQEFAPVTIVEDTIRYDNSNGLIIEYVNNKHGIRQNFYLKDKPAGKEKLQLKMNLQTNLDLQQKTDTDLIFYKSDAGKIEKKLTYNNLKVWDANDKVLPAVFKISDSTLEIEIDDLNAVYPIVIDPLTSSFDWMVSGDQNNSSFGFTVSSAGDVNKDGYGDVIVGAYQYDNGQNDEGRAFVYHGSASGLSTVFNWTAESNLEYSHFGYSVAGAGDVNGDGFSDVTIAAPGWYDQTGKRLSGKVFVYNGTPNGLELNPSWTGESDQVYSEYGSSVSNAGDINGDGYSDIVVGAPGYYNGEYAEGKAYIYNGSESGLNIIPNWTFESNLSNALLGSSVSNAGDVNGDGYDDVIIGAPAYNNSTGRVFLFHGSSMGLSVIANLQLDGDQSKASFGRSVSSAGDVNADGFSDVIVGVPEFNKKGSLLEMLGFQTDEGKALVFHGSPTGIISAPKWAIEIDQSASYYGTSVSYAGDLNADGYSDVIVGATQYDKGKGKAFVYYGNRFGLSSLPNWTTGEDLSTFVKSVSDAGDVNKDGFDDIIIGTLGYSVISGSAFVYHGSVYGLSALPVLSNTYKSIKEDENLKILKSEFRSAFASGDTLSKIKITKLPLNGSLMLGTNKIQLHHEILIDTFSSLLYVPDNNFYGNDSFGWNASNTAHYSKNDAQVIITLDPVNDGPQVKIISPLNGAFYPSVNSIVLTVNAKDVDGIVTLVEFYNHGVKFGEDATIPYEFTGTNVEPGNYKLTAKAKDNFGLITISDTVNITVNPCFGSGSISARGYVNIPGSLISDLTSNPTYPNGPSVVLQLDKFEYGNNIGDNYGGRLRGYICAPQTGDYIFYIASDDQSELWLSTDQNPTNKRKIAYLNWATFLRAWNLFPTQKSAPVRLTKGFQYYIETIHKEGIGFDHLSVAWTLPNGVFEGPIDGSRLSPFESSPIAGVRAQGFSEAMEASQGFSVQATPNPSSNYFTIVTKSDRKETLSITVTDVMGRIVERRLNVSANGTIQLGNAYGKGVYFVEVKQGAKKEKLQLIRK